VNVNATLFFVRISFLNMLAYRSRYYTGILTYTVHVAVHSSILLAVWSSSMTHFTQAELMTFIAIGYIIRSCTFCNLDQEIASQITDGSMAMDLLKPLDYPAMQFARATGSMLFRLFIFTGPIGIAAFIMFKDIQGPQNLFAFVFSTFLAFWMFAQITFLIGLCAIKLHSIGGIIRVKNHALNLLMGLTLPLAFIKTYSETAHQIILLTPFPHMSHTPVMIYMNRLQDLHADSIMSALMNQFIWAVALTAVARFAWLAVKKHIMIQGG
jgi:ABC-2 type transport system permease protein